MTMMLFEELQMTCPDCKGAGVIPLLTSTMPCARCAKDRPLTAAMIDELMKTPMMPTRDVSDFGSSPYRPIKPQPEIPLQIATALGEAVFDKAGRKIGEIFSRNVCLPLEGFGEVEIRVSCDPDRCRRAFGSR
jgi:hypothetical protein